MMTMMMVMMMMMVKKVTITVTVVMTSFVIIHLYKQLVYPYTTSPTTH